MGVERLHRLDGDVHSPKSAVDADAVEPAVPGKRTLLEQVEQVEQLAARIAKAMTPGRRTLVEHTSPEQPSFDDDRALAPAARAPGYDRAAGVWGRAELFEDELVALSSSTTEPRFDEFRARGLAQILRVALAHGGRRLLDATLGASDPAVAQAAAPSTQTRPPRGQPGGRAMWRAAERVATTLYRRAVDSGDADADSPAAHAALRRLGSGQPLPSDVRRAMEEKLGVSLERVRIHTDRVAAEAARAVHAEAFTVGEDIFFADGAFAPESRDGERLLAHELTHVVQAWQGRAVHKGGVSAPNDPLEREADEVADRVAPVRTPRPSRRAAVAPRPLPSPAPGAPTLLRRAKRGAQRHNIPPTRARHRRPVKEARQGTQGAGADFSERSKQATAQATAPLAQGLAAAKANPPGKRVAALTKAAGKQAEADDAEVRAHEKQQRAKAKTRANEGHETDGAAPQPGKQERIDPRSPIQLKPIDDWSKFMPEPLPDQDERERVRIQKLVKAKIEGERRSAREGYEQLRQAHLKQAREVRAMRPKLLEEIAKAQQAALSKVAAAESSQCAAVQSHVASVQGQVRGHAAAMKSQITAAHSAAIARIDADHQAGLEKLAGEQVKALDNANNAETLALFVLALDYVRVRSEFTRLGSRKAGDALITGEDEARKMAGKWDGDGDKIQAAQDAARDTANGFALAMPEQAAEQLGKVESERPAKEEDVRGLTRLTRDKITAGHDGAKDAADATKDQSTAAANAARDAALSQIDQACNSTVAQLAAHGASQVAAIRKQARDARAGITGGGQAARGSVTQTCDQSASGIEKGIIGILRGAKQIEAPDPAATQAQIAQSAVDLDRGTDGIGKGLRASATKSSADLTQQAAGAVDGIAQVVASARTAAAQIGSGAKQQMTGIATGTSTALTQGAQHNKDAIDKHVGDAVKDFGHQVELLGSAYKQTAETRRGDREGKYIQCEDGLKVVPDKGSSGGAGTKKEEEGGGEEGAQGEPGEIDAIRDNANKAADAVKPWWQEMLAFVVSILVVIIITVAAAALTALTGPIGALLITLAAGALSGALSTMASNLVLGNPIWDGVVQGALTGLIGAGVGGAAMKGLGALAKVAGKAPGLLGRGAGMTSNALGASAKGFAQNAIKQGAEFGTEFVGEQFANLLVTGKVDITVEGLLLAAATQAGMSNPKFEKFQENMGKRMLPSSKLPQPTGGGAAAGGGGAPVADAGGGSAPVSQPGPAPAQPPRSAPPPVPAPRPAPAPPPPRAPEPAPPPPAADPAPRAPDPVPTPERPPPTPAPQPGKTPVARDENKSPTRDDADRSHDPSNDEAGGAHGNGKTEGADDGKDKGKGAGNPPNGESPSSNDGNESGDTGGPPGVGGTPPRDAEAGGDAANVDDAPSASDGEFNELGYPQATRTKAEEAAAAIESGGAPTPESLRDTQANQDGLRDLDRVRSDATRTPEQRAEFLRGLAARVREKPAPTGNLRGDVEAVRADTQNADPTGQPPDGTSTAEHDTPGKDTRGQSGGPPKPPNQGGPPRSASDGDEPNGPVTADAFPTPELVVRTNDPIAQAKFAEFAKRYPEIVNQQLAITKQRLDDATTPEERTQALEDSYRAIMEWRARVAEEMGGDGRRFLKPITDDNLNFDPFGDMPAVREGATFDPDAGRYTPGTETPASRTRRDVGDRIEQRFEGVDADAIQNEVTLPNGEVVPGNRLHRGDSAQQVYDQERPHGETPVEGHRRPFGFDPDSNKLFTETASPANQKRLHDAGIELLADITSRGPLTSPAARAKANRDFANAAYMLFQGPLVKRGSDSTIRAFLTMAHTQAFGDVPRLPHDIDVQAYTRTQSDFIDWLIGDSGGPAGKAPPPDRPDDGGSTPGSAATPETSGPQTEQPRATKGDPTSDPGSGSGAGPFTGGMAGKDPNNAEDMLTDPDPPPEVAEVVAKIREQTRNAEMEGSAKIDAGRELDALWRNHIQRRETEVSDMHEALQDNGYARVTNDEIATVFDYLFQSAGITKTYDNYAAWRRLTTGNGTVGDVRFMVHELAEQRAMRDAGMADTLGRGENPADTEWQKRFADFYLPAHDKALRVEGEFLVDEIARLSGGRVRLTVEELAASDPRAEMRTFMTVDGVALSDHPSAAAWQRGNEPVTLAKEIAERLRLPVHSKIADVIRAVKSVPLSESRDIK